MKIIYLTEVKSFKSFIGLIVIMIKFSTTKRCCIVVDKEDGLGQKEGLLPREQSNKGRSNK